MDFLLKDYEGPTIAEWLDHQQSLINEVPLDL